LVSVSLATRGQADVRNPSSGQRFKNYVDIDVSGLNVVRGRDGVYVIPGESLLDLVGGGPIPCSDRQWNRSSSRPRTSSCCSNSPCSRPLLSCPANQPSMLAKHAREAAKASSPADASTDPSVSVGMLTGPAGP